jgi:predicted NUDIX family NTP pyrophosphohydrolase
VTPMNTPVLSVGLLLYRLVEGELQVLLAHMGGPFWARRDNHAWTIPKGRREEGDDDLLAVALREFAEEMGSAPPGGQTHDLGEWRAGPKTNHVFAREADFEASGIVSNTFEMEWPPRSGRREAFPEVDRAAWMAIGDARQKLVKGMLPFLDRLEAEVSP